MGLVVVPALFITALIFFTLIGTALIYPKSWWGKLLAVCIVLSPLVWLTWDIPVGYVRYKSACKTDAGLKIYSNNLSPATRVRLVDSAGYPETVLNEYASIQQVEARDHELNYLRPTVYAVYERGANGKLVSTLMDKIIETRNGVRLAESNPSTADYSIEEKYESLPYRLSRTNYTLHDKNHQLVAETISYIYTTSDPDHSIGWTSFGCGPRGLNRQLKILISIIVSSR